MPNKKVYLLQEIIPSYRVPVFRQLAKIEGVDLTVFYSRQSRAMRNENLKSADSFDGFRHRETGLAEVGVRAYQFGIIWTVLRDRPDVLIAGQAFRTDRLLLLLVCKLVGVRLLWYVGGVPYIDKNRVDEYKRRGRMRRWLGKFDPARVMVLLADGLVAYSDNAKRYYMEEGMRKEKIWVAPNSPDTDALYAYQAAWAGMPGLLASLRDKFAPDGEKILFIVGRLNKERKVDVLLHAVRNLQAMGYPVSLVIVGDGGERKVLEHISADLALKNVFFEGGIYDEKELSRYFMVCDIFVTPGVASLAIKMAMLFGKPVVTVDYGLEVHGVQDGINGLIFPMDDVDVLTERLADLLKSEEMIARVGNNAANTIRERININMMISGLRRAIFAEPDMSEAANG